MAKIRNVGKVLKILKATCGYTSKDVAERTGLSLVFISELERGKKKASFESIEKIAKCYNIGTFQLIDLIEYYERLEGDDLEKYQLTLYRALKLILKRSV